MQNYDIKKDRPRLYGAKRSQFNLIDVPRMKFLMADGHGSPNTSPEYPAEGLAPRGRHHEIYLSDARRTDPSRLRTILRQPVSPAQK